MQVRSKIFPYPVLNNNTLFSNYGTYLFDFKFEEKEDEYNYVLNNICFQTDSKLINDLLDKNLISVYCVVECSDTVYRKAYKLDRKPSTLNLPKSDFTEKVEISIYAAANDNFILKSDEFDEEYKSIDFEIEKYDILAANDGFNVHFIHEEKEDNLVKSIFSIVPSEDIEDGTFHVDSNQGRKIVITMSNEDHKNYGIVYTDDDYKEVFFNMLIVPALIDSLNICKIKALSDTDLDIDDLGNEYMWFRSVVSGYKRITGEDLTISDFREMPCVLLAQIVMGKPLGSALVNLIHSKAKEVEEDE